MSANTRHGHASLNRKNCEDKGLYLAQPLTAVRLLTGKDTQRSRRAHTHTHMCTCAHGGD